MTTLNASTSRRRFLKGAGALTLSFSVPLVDVYSQTAPEKPRLVGDLQTNRMLSAWIRIQSADKSVLLMVGKVELGQGILTAMQQVCAEELDVDFSRIRMISGDTSLVPNEGTTAGSFSMPNGASAVQQASAEVRAILLGLAATQLGQPTAGMSVNDGVITAAIGAKITYWDLLVGQSLQREADGKAKPKPIGEHRVIGRSVPRPDLDDKIAGRPIFLQEQHPAGMLYGYVVRPPAYTARLISLDTAPIERMPGVVKVVRSGSFLGVVATREAQALAASQAMSAAAKWNVPKALPTTAGVENWLMKAPVDKVIETKRQPRLSPARLPRWSKPATSGRITCMRPSALRQALPPWAVMVFWWCRPTASRCLRPAWRLPKCWTCRWRKCACSTCRVPAVTGTTWQTMPPPTPPCWLWQCRVSRCFCNTPVNKSTSGSPTGQPWSSRPKPAWTLKAISSTGT